MMHKTWESQVCKTEEELGAQFGGDNGVEVTEYLVDLIADPHFVVDDGGSGMAGLRDGSISALFTGSWDAASIREILGENMGRAIRNGSTTKANAAEQTKAMNDAMNSDGIS